MPPAAEEAGTNTVHPLLAPVQLPLGSPGDVLPTGRYHVANSRSDCIRYLMLPEAQNSPAQGAQVLRSLAISQHVALQLRPPPISMLLRAGRMARAAVPEASVKEDGDLLSGKGNVDASARQARHRDVDSIA